MTADFVLHALLGLLPVCCFLAALVYLDSYKLVPLKWVVGTIVLGCATGVASYPLNLVGLQWLDVDFTFLTFVGEAGTQPGQFYGASGIAIRGDEFAVVDQLSRRLQIFRFIVPKDR